MSNALYNSRGKVIWEMTAQERAFEVAFAIADNGGVTTKQVSELTGLTRQGAWYLMQRATRLPRSPVVQDEEGRWVRMK
jgi:hypothetical protein